MDIKKRPIFIVLAAGVFLITFYLLYTSLVNEFKSTAVTKSDLIREHVQVSSNIIDGLATYGHMFFEDESIKDSEFISYLQYDPASDLYHMDAVEGTLMEKSVGGITGIGSIPADGAARDNLNLALQYNHFFENFYKKFPDIAWLYYTGEQGFLNIYPWVSSENFSYKEDLKNVEFYDVATPENNPSRIKVWTPVYLDAAGKGRMVTLSAPVYSKNIFQGVVSLDLTNAWLSKEIATSYEGYLIDDTLTVLASSKSELSSDKIDKLNNHLRFSPEEIEALLDLRKDHVNAFNGYYIYTSNFQDAPWTLITLVPIWTVVGKAALFTMPILVICILLLLSMNQIERRRKSEEQLAKKNSLLETTLSSVGEGIIVTDQLGRVTLLNNMAEEITGWAGGEAQGQEFSEVFNCINLQTGEKRPNPVKAVLEGGMSICSAKNAGLVSRTGAEVYITGTASAMHAENGSITGVVVSFRDITREYEQEKQIEGFLELNFDMLSVVDIDGNIHKVNRKFEEVLGYSSEELEKKGFLSFIHDEDIPKTLAAIGDFNKNKTANEFTNRFRCKDGSYKYIEWHTQPRTGKFIYSSARDVTEQIMKTEELETLAGMDQLTGTYNRYYFDSIIKGEMSRADYYGEPLSMALLDMDHFKNVNDTWGHPVGDEVLKQTAKIIEAVIREADLLIRFGGEEFLLLMPNTHLKGAAVVSEKIRAAIENHTFPVAGRQTASIGVAERLKTEPFLQWYERVDKALYEAKKSGRNRVIPASESLPGHSDRQFL